MPRSKKSKVVSLTKTAKKGREWKQKLIDNLREAVKKYDTVYLFSYENMRNNLLKTVRESWKGSRFFLGNNKVMQVALGRNKETEVETNLYQLSKRLTGNRGLLFTNSSHAEVVRFFETYQEADYARAGAVATQTVQLLEGSDSLKQFAHSIEPYLRQLGMPTQLKDGKIHLLCDWTVCTEGETLNPEQAKILKLLEIPMAKFHIIVEAKWSKTGAFEQYRGEENEDSDNSEDGDMKD